MDKPVVVFGSFVVDLTSRSQGLPVPGQTLMGSSFKMGPGGKGSNQAVAAHRFGAKVQLITKIGNDVFGKVASDFYRSEGMDTSHVLVDDEKETGIALILVDEDSAQNEIVVVPGACANITPSDVERVKPVIQRAGVLLTQLETNKDALYQAIAIAHEAGVPVVLNTAPASHVPDEILAMVDVVTPNETEAQALTGVQVVDEESAARAAKVFLDKGVKKVVITMGKLGAYATDGKTSQLLPSIRVNAIDTTGAGDAFNGALAAALCQGKDLFTALKYANATGALSVTRLGTAPAMPFEGEVKALVREQYGI